MARKRKLGSYPSMMITFSLTVALFLIGFCGLLALNSRELLKKVRQNIEMQVYLDKEMTQIQIDSLKNVLAQKPFVAYQNKTPEITFIAKETIAAKFIKDTKEDYRNVLTENPFRNAFAIKIKDTYFDEVQLAKIKTELEQNSGIFEVDYAKGIVESINKTVNRAYIVIAIFVILLLCVILVLANNTIRLALYSQRFIVRSMQLVGATDGFIQKPFLKRSIIQGFLAALIAIVLLFMLHEFARVNMSEIVIFQDYPTFALLALVLLILGVLISFLCTFQSIYRYLRMNLDELY